MVQIDARTSGQEEHCKPILMVITDGGENASNEFTSEKMREMIGERQAKKGWEFLFIAANQDAWQVASNYGITNNNITRSYNYAGGCVLSGAIASGCVVATNAFGFQANAFDMAAAIGSGMVAASHIASGSYYNSQQMPAKVEVNVMVSAQ